MRRRRNRRRLAGLLIGSGGVAALVLLLPATPPEPRLDPTLLAATRTPRPHPAPTPSETASAAAVRSDPGARPREPGAPDSVVPATPAAPRPQTIEAQPGDTPLKLLARIGVAPEDAQAAIRKLATVWDPRDLKAGQKAAVFVQSDRLLSVRLALAPDHDVVVARDDTGRFVAESQDRPTREVPAVRSGTIHSSLSGAATRAAVPPAVLAEMIRAFSYDIDFQREIRPGDNFTVLYRRVDDEFGRPTGGGHMVYAEMVLSGTRLRLYRYTPPGGQPGYYTALGENIIKPLLRTPVDAVRISSGFGMRLHPILGYSRMHRGVDFAAPSGTAVYAAGDGVVVEAGRHAGYGNYIEIQHNKEYATAYGHLRAFAHGLHAGEHVKQGDVIGYVGMTGMATGPHLHYEVHQDGVQVDPLSLKMPALTRLAGSDLKAFQARRDDIERELRELRRGPRRDLVARADCRAGAC
ncbi:MAG: peptidoglycan DD-metalloendopeptidase family protein [Thiohalocapsa sp.]